MALARIFTRHPEHTFDLAQQLQQHGYTIEVLGPEESPPSPADLEIQLEVCDPASVLRRVGELATRFHTDIAVAPGVLPAESLPAEAAACPSLPEDQPARADAPVIPLAEPVEPLSPEPVAQAIDVARPVASEAAASAASRSDSSARAFGAAVAACAAVAGRLLASARDQFRESWELAQIRNAEAYALREQHLLELTRQRAAAQQRALEFAAEHKNVAAYLLQLKEEVPNALADIRRQWSTAEDAVPPEPPARVWRLKIKRIHSRKWEAVFAGLLSASALFAIGLAVAAFNSRSSQSANRGVTVQTGGVTLPGAQQKSALSTRSSPALRKVTQKPAAIRTRQGQRRPQHLEEDVVANDVVVRHFAKAKPTPRTQAEGWKHFSDMDN